MSGKYSYRNLIVWQQAQELAFKILHLVERVPRSWANAVLVRQIVASATSVGANIAEGHGRYNTGSYRNHLSIAKGSAVETDSWLDLFRRSDWISGEEEEALRNELMAIMGTLTIKIRDLERIERNAKTKLRETAASYEASEDLQPTEPFTDNDYATDAQLS